MVVVWRGVESIRRLQAFGAPFMFVMAAALLIWVRVKAGSFGAMLSTPSRFHSTNEFLAVFFPSLTAMVGYWATLALNIPDFTRYSKSQSAQSWGQAFGLPVAMVLYTFLGIAVTSASSVLFGRPIWDPVQLIGMFHQPLVAFVAMIAVLVATLNVNIGANVVSPSNDFSNLYPRLISFRTGGLITGFLGLAMCPWKLLATPDAYIFGWLVGYSGLLGPVAGIMVCDYFFIRGTELDVNSLYHRDGIYHYTKGRQSAGADRAGAGRGHCAGGVDRAQPAFPLRLRVVRRLLHGGRIVCGDDENRVQGSGVRGQRNSGRWSVIEGQWSGIRGQGSTAGSCCAVGNAPSYPLPFLGKVVIPGGLAFEGGSRKQLKAKRLIDKVVKIGTLGDNLRVCSVLAAMPSQNWVRCPSKRAIGERSFSGRPTCRDHLASTEIVAISAY